MVREDCRLKMVVTKDINHNPHRCDGGNSRLIDTELRDTTQKTGVSEGAERTQLCETQSHTHNMMGITLLGGDPNKQRRHNNNKV